jgi:hypothetical protein
VAEVLVGLAVAAADLAAAAPEEVGSTSAFSFQLSVYSELKKATGHKLIAEG